ncbi:MAG TPA: 23S rRNA (guanosine(2251)-2'-O)-methyltransferase RlmB [Salinimicrobium sp.]|nr:23S rRNA (guanosine(2251)-2'-O)-methyltransferase RlmB [Salinimicrobium sp.]
MKESTNIFGIRAVIEAVQNGKSIDKIYLQKGLHGSLIQELQKLIAQHSLNFSYVPIEKLNKLVHGNHQGVIASISPIHFSTLDEEVPKSKEGKTYPLFLILDQITDARNFGAIIRTAECCGVSAIIIQKKSAAPVNADTIKTSAGAVFNVPIIKVDHIKDAIHYMQSSEITVIAATEKTSNLLYEIDFNIPVAIVMGNEEKGVSEGVLKLVNNKAKLPLMGTIASLNVSVACGAFLYEIVRQRL